MEILIKILEENYTKEIIFDFMEIFKMYENEKNKESLFIFENFLDDKIIFFLISFFQLLEENFKNKIFLKFSEIFSIFEIFNFLICKYSYFFLKFKNIFFNKKIILKNILFLLENFSNFIFTKNLVFLNSDIKKQFSFLKIFFFNLSLNSKNDNFDNFEIENSLKNFFEKKKKNLKINLIF